MERDTCRGIVTIDAYQVYRNSALMQLVNDAPTPDLKRIPVKYVVACSGDTFAVEI
jgi:hypothetical protein